MELGTKLGHYEVLGLLGKGGMGSVWRARDTKLGREVAIKTLPEEFAKDADHLFGMRALRPNVSRVDPIWKEQGVLTMAIPPRPIHLPLLIGVMFITMCPLALGQTATDPLVEFPGQITQGQNVLVVDTSGREYKGRVADLSASSMMLQIGGQSRRFAATDGATTHHRDSLIEGMFIGAGLGAGLGLWDYLIDPSEPGNGAVTGAMIILGGGIGALVDAGFQKALYRVPAPTVSGYLIVVPQFVLSPEQTSLRITLKF